MRVYVVCVPVSVYVSVCVYVVCVPVSKHVSGCGCVWVFVYGCLHACINNLMHTLFDVSSLADGFTITKSPRSRQKSPLVSGLHGLSVSTSRNVGNLSLVVSPARSTFVSEHCER